MVIFSYKKVIEVEISKFNTHTHHYKGTHTHTHIQMSRYRARGAEHGQHFSNSKALLIKLHKQQTSSLSGLKLRRWIGLGQSRPTSLSTLKYLSCLSLNSQKITKQCSSTHNITYRTSSNLNKLFYENVTWMKLFWLPWIVLLRPIIMCFST